MHRLVKIGRTLTNLRRGGRHILSVFSESLSATGDNTRPGVRAGFDEVSSDCRPNGRSAKSDTGGRHHLLITAEIFEQSCWYEVCLQSLCRPKQSSPLTTMSAFISLSTSNSVGSNVQTTSTTKSDTYEPCDLFIQPKSY